MSLEKLAKGDTKEIGSNTLEYAMDDPVSRGISFFGRIPAQVVLLSGHVGNYPREEVQKFAKEYVKNSNLENVTVRLGHSRILKDTKRLFTDKKLEDIPLVSRILLGIPVTLLGGFAAKLSRADYYNPLTRTSHIYSDVKAIAGHEIGHAEDFQNKKHTTLYSLARALFFPVTLYQEYKASQYSHRHLADADKWQTGRYLFPAFGTYVAAAFVNPFMKTASLLSTVFIVGSSYLLGKIYSSFKKFGSREPVLDANPC